MGRPRPTPRTDADMYAAAMLDSLDEIRDLMRDVRDRLPAQPEPRTDGTVELREPAQAKPAEADNPGEVELTEPKTDTAEDEMEPAPAGAARPRRKSTRSRKGST